MKLSRKPFSKGLRSLEAGPQVASRRMRNPPLKPGVRPGFQLKLTNRERPSERTAFPFSLPRLRQPERREYTNGRRGENQAGRLVFHERILCAKVLRVCGRAFVFILVDFSSREIGKIKRGFRGLRATAQGSALRTRSLSRKAGESFSRGAVQGIFKLYRSLIVFSREI